METVHTLPNLPDTKMTADTIFNVHPTAPSRA